MAKVHHVGAARRAFPKHGIKVGDEYWWWAPYRQPVVRSRVEPRPSQLIQSRWVAALRAQETIEDAGDDRTMLAMAIKAAHDDLSCLADDYDQAQREMRGEVGSNSRRADHLRHMVDDLSQILLIFALGASISDVKRRAFDLDWDQPAF